MTETTKKRAEIVSTFTDAGTGETFEANATPLIDAGAYANYEAAGLVRAPTAKAQPQAKPKAKAKAKAAPKAAPAAAGTSTTTASAIATNASLAAAAKTPAST